MTNTESAAREEQLQRENTTLRAIVAKIMPCHYCGVDDIAKCPAGFPGCDLADDISAYDSLVWTEYRALKQNLTSEPAEPEAIGARISWNEDRSDILEALCLAAQLLDAIKPDAVKEGWWTEHDDNVRKMLSNSMVRLDSYKTPPKPEPVASVPVTRDVLVKHFKSRIQPPFAAPETLAQEGFLERFEARAQKKAEDDADAILALLAASTGERGAVPFDDVRAVVQKHFHACASFQAVTDCTHDLVALIGAKQP